MSVRALLTLAHLIGLGLAVGAATVKLALLLGCRSDQSFIQSFLAVSRPITRVIILGLALLTLSGMGLVAVGYPLRSLLVAKIGLVVALWALGPVIDNIVEPRFRLLAPVPGEAASSDFVLAEQRYLFLEVVATGLFYVIIVMWVLL